MKKNIYTSCATGESFIPPKKHPEIIRIRNFNVDPDPDLATQINADPHGPGSGYVSGSETLLIIFKK
jgi:hypothetical protein